MNTSRWRWYHGVIFYAGVQAVTFGLASVARRARPAGSDPKPLEQLVGNREYNAYYNALRQPSYAPPDWLFPPAWTLNNATAIAGLLRVLNLPPETPGRQAFLRLQAAFWADFVAFTPVFFGLRSPILGAVNTHLGFLLTVASMGVATARLRDPLVAWSQLPTLAWLALAVPTATSIARTNPDHLFRPQLPPSSASSAV